MMEELDPDRNVEVTAYNSFGAECPLCKGKGKASSLDIAPLTILDSSALQPRKWQLTGNDCSTAAQAVAAQRPC